MTFTPVQDYYAYTPGSVTQVTIGVTDDTSVAPSATIDASCFSLTRNGVDILSSAPNGVGAFTSNGDWTFSNLGPLTQAMGSYELSFNTSSGVEIQDAAGNNLAVPAQVHWTVDNPLPVVDHVTRSSATLGDADVGAGTFSVTIVYNKSMYTDGTPVVDFMPPDPDPDGTEAQAISNTLRKNDSMSGWSFDRTTYVAAYDVVGGADVQLSDIGIDIPGTHGPGDYSGAVDPIGVHTPEYTGAPTFSIETHADTSEYPAIVTQALADHTLVTLNDEGTATFAVRVFYDEPMNRSSAPTITFSPDVITSGALTLNTDTNHTFWVNAYEYLATYNVPVSSVDTENIGITVSGALDAAGNSPTIYTRTSAFTIDTADPAPTPASVTGVTPSVTEVTQTNLSQQSPATVNEGFALRIFYDESMNYCLANPSVTLTATDQQDLDATLQFHSDPNQSFWINAHTYKAEFIVNSSSLAIPASAITVNVTAAIDAAGDLQAPYTSPATFSIDMTTTATLASVLTVAPNRATILVANEGVQNPNTYNSSLGITLWITYNDNDPMQMIGGPTITFSTDVSTVLTPDANWSFWISPTLYVATFDVASTPVFVSGIGFTIDGARDLIGNVQDLYSATNVFTINTTGQ